MLYNLCLQLYKVQLTMFENVMHGVLVVWPQQTHSEDESEKEGVRQLHGATFWAMLPSVGNQGRHRAHERPI